MIQQDEQKRASPADGVVLELTMKGDGIIDVMYTVDLILGANGNTYPMLIDTGSSDLWVASNSCQGCNAPASYNPSSSSTSTSTGQNFRTTYLSGSVSGPIYWEQTTLGPYTILNQALAAADNVQNEALSQGFSGILGLALPPQSIIQQAIPAGSGGGSEDGATVLSNLFGLPDGTGPTNKYFSVSLSRPGFDDPTRSKNAYPSRLGIGTHVDEVVQAVTQATGNSNFEAGIGWVNLIDAAAGYTHWRTRLSSITVWKNGTQGVVSLGTGVDGGAGPVAVLDTGGANWYATKKICDAFYGSWGAGMGSDGMYYVPCQTAMNATLTFGTITVPLHPLDLSNDPENNPNPSGDCLGTLQYSAQLGQLNSPADIVLGVSFLRNVYTVHSLAPPGSDTDNADGTVVPKLGIVPLTNISLALTEFNNMRVLNRGPDGGRNDADRDSNAGKDSLGVIGKIMIGLGVFAAVCIALFAARWIVLSRRFKQRQRRGLPSEVGHGVERSEESVPMREWVNNITRKKTQRFQQISDYGTPDGIEGDVATKSAYGHGSLLSRAHTTSRFTTATHADVARRPSSIRQGSGPWAGFSLLTFLGARRLGFGGQKYQRTANPTLPEEDGLHRDSMPTEDELRRQRFENYRRETGGQGRGNEPSVWSDVTWVDRGDGTLAPLGSPGLAPGTPAATVVGSTTNLNAYGFPKVDEFGAAKYEEEDEASTVHGSPVLPPKGGDFASSSTSLANRMSIAGIGTPSRGGSRDFLPLHNKSSSGSLTAGGIGGSPYAGGIGGTPSHGHNRSLPNLDFDPNRPHSARVDSTGIIMSSPYPIGDSEPNTPGSRPGTIPTPLHGSTGTVDPTSFDPYQLPVTIPAPPTLQPVHPHKQRIQLAVEPSLSPLTEVTSQEFPSSRSDPSRLSAEARRLSALAAADSTRNSLARESLERQSSISSALSMESEVLVPLPITLMEMARQGQPLPSNAWEPRSSVIREEPEPVDPPFAPPRMIQDVAPPAPPPKVETPRAHPPPSLPAIHRPPMHSHPTAPAAIASTSNPHPQPHRSRNPFDLLGFDAPEARDSRFPSFDVLGASDSRYPTLNPSSSNPRLRPPNVRSTSDSPSRPTSVADPEVAVRARPRLTDPTLPRPYSEMDVRGDLVPPPPLFGDGSRGRSYSGSNLQLTGRAGSRDAARDPPRVASRSRERPVEDPLRDFMPPHEVRAPHEQQTLPAMTSSRPQLPESAVASVGARHRGPRPMAHKRTGSATSPSSSPPASTSSTRQGTAYDSPVSSSDASSPPTASILALGPRPSPFGHSSRSSSGSLPLGTTPAHAPVTHTTPVGRAPNLSPATSSPPHAYGIHQPTREPSISATTAEGPDAAYGGMASESSQGGNGRGWREDAARTAGVAGLGARSRFIGDSLKKPDSS